MLTTTHAASLVDQVLVISEYAIDVYCCNMLSVDKILYWTLNKIPWFSPYIIQNNRATMMNSNHTHKMTVPSRCPTEDPVPYKKKVLNVQNNIFRNTVLKVLTNI